MGSLFWAFYWGSPGYQKLELKELIAMKKPCQLIVHLIVHLQERGGGMTCSDTKTLLLLSVIMRN